MAARLASIAPAALVTIGMPGRINGFAQVETRPGADDALAAQAVPAVRG